MTHFLIHTLATIPPAYLAIITLATFGRWIAWMLGHTLYQLLLKSADPKREIEAFEAHPVAYLWGFFADLFLWWPLEGLAWPRTTTLVVAGSWAWYPPMGFENLRGEK